MGNGRAQFRVVVLGAPSSTLAVEAFQRSKRCWCRYDGTAPLQQEQKSPRDMLVSLPNISIASAAHDA